jgi:hypothetical protein
MDRSPAAGPPVDLASAGLLHPHPPLRALIHGATPGEVMNGILRWFLSELLDGEL